MGKLCLRLAFTAIGFNFLALKLGEVFNFETPLFYVVALCLPAALYGSISWLMVRSFARSWQVVACVAIAWVGLLYAFHIEKNRGIVAVSYITMVLPIAALIVEHRCWWLCARTYVIANAVAMGVALWFDYVNSTLGHSLYRFGFLLSNDGIVRLANPNIIGSQLALAAVLAFMLYLRDGRHEKRRKTGHRPKKFSLGWTVLLSLGCIFTSSRGAFSGWFAGMALLMFWETRSQRSSKLKDMVAVFSMGIALAMFVVIAAELTFWQTLQRRLNTEQLITASNRTVIWEAAFHTWHSNEQYLLIGTGTGVAPEAIGAYMGLTKPDGVTPVGPDAHSAFVEWGLSFGLLGMIFGTCLMVSIIRTAHRLDCRGRTVNRRALLICFCFTSMTFVSFYQLLFVSGGALILASLSEPQRRVRAIRPSRSEESRQPAPAERRRGLPPKRRWKASNPVSQGSRP